MKSASEVIDAFFSGQTISKIVQDERDADIAGDDAWDSPTIEELIRGYLIGYQTAIEATRVTIAAADRDPSDRESFELRSYRDIALRTGVADA